jgi:arginine/lysine/ornithine decarboxylase
LTHKPALQQSGSTTTQTLQAQSIADAVRAHGSRETVSFHTPGHKGASDLFQQPLVADTDLTELPGLDDLSAPTGVLASLQRRAAALFGSSQSLISVNGASAGLIAAICASVPLGSRLLVPVNCHRSVISGLVAGGQDPLWYEPQWNDNWSMHGAVDASVIRAHLKEDADIAAVVVTSPTYGGSISDIQSIAKICKQRGVALIVDEAHGAHNFLVPNAVTAGADVVIHSLHKTLPALTQSGLIHVSPDSLISAQSIKECLNLVQTSSPSYVVLSSIDSTITWLGTSSGLSRIGDISLLAEKIKSMLLASGRLELFADGLTDAAHILVRSPHHSGRAVFDAFFAAGIGAEAVIGDGVLLLLGAGSSEDDLFELSDRLPIVLNALEKPGSSTRPTRNRTQPALHVMNPRAAFFAKSEYVSPQSAEGRIAAECFAPCPPGLPVIIPGQRITKESLSLCGKPEFKVVIESSIQGDK